MFNLSLVCIVLKLPKHFKSHIPYFHYVVVVAIINNLLQSLTINFDGYHQRPMSINSTTTVYQLLILITWLPPFNFWPIYLGVITTDKSDHQLQQLSFVTGIEDGIVQPQPPQLMASSKDQLRQPQIKIDNFSILQIKHIYI